MAAGAATVAAEAGAATVAAAEAGAARSRGGAAGRAATRGVVWQLRKGPGRAMHGRLPGCGECMCQDLGVRKGAATL